MGESGQGERRSMLDSCAHGAARRLVWLGRLGGVPGAVASSGHAGVVPSTASVLRLGACWQGPAARPGRCRAQGQGLARSGWVLASW
jgi:hypothetical protein